MKIAFISDVHGNLEALTTALEHIDKDDVDQLVCLGDVVGYGPNPNECVEIVHDRCNVVLMGNHDYAAIGLANIEYFNEFAKISTRWTINTLKDDNKNYLRSLPFSHQDDEMIMVHSSPTNPSHWYYVLSMPDALIEMQAFSQNLCFIGHSHVPLVFSNQDMIREPLVQIEQNHKYIVNVGSVGQPRDGNPQLCYTLYDTHKREIKYVRLDYDIHTTYAKIIEAGLPLYLAERLLKGY